MLKSYQYYISFSSPVGGWFSPHDAPGTPTPFILWFYAVELLSSLCPEGRGENIEIYILPSTDIPLTKTSHMASSVYKLVTECTATSSLYTVRVKKSSSVDGWIPGFQHGVSALAHGMGLDSLLLQQVLKMIQHVTNTGYSGYLPFSLLNHALPSPPRVPQSWTPPAALWNSLALWLPVGLTKGEQSQIGRRRGWGEETAPSSPFRMPPWGFASLLAVPAHLAGSLHRPFGLQILIRVPSSHPFQSRASQCPTRILFNPYGFFIPAHTQI